MSEQGLREEIHRYGDPVLRSDQFRKAMQQKHHFGGSVGEHTLRVTATSLRLCHALERLGIRTDTCSVVRGALCHDLGIVGRYEKYRNNRECCVEHPKDSVQIARELFPELDEKTERIIRRHMWPLGGSVPGSREEVIVSLSDKYASVKDVLYGGYVKLRKRRKQPRRR